MNTPWCLKDIDGNCIKRTVNFTNSFFPKYIPSERTCIISLLSTTLKRQSMESNLPLTVIIYGKWQSFLIRALNLGCHHNHSSSPNKEAGCHVSHCLLLLRKRPLTLQSMRQNFSKAWTLPWLLIKAFDHSPSKSSNLNISYATYVDQCYVSRSV